LDIKSKTTFKIIFRLAFEKNRSQKLAKKFNLPVAEKKDSQGICFWGGRFERISEHYIKPKRQGMNEVGEQIGYHDEWFSHMGNGMFYDY